MADALEVHVTAPDAAQAAEMARTLVKEGLVACVNIVPGVRSIYFFEGKLCDDAEVLCIVKTRPALFDRLQQRIRELHPYQVPEILSFAVDEGTPSYLEWLRASTGGETD
ncbi:MAG TPA: divalent-cation tolerance protein CutA [Polyangia bacterium]|jgi:periplasmic divalent cation tolerance protein|nr:divalent-cation tolerance protein CutA [Polyangia bacterium]